MTKNTEIFVLNQDEVMAITGRDMAIHITYLVCMPVWLMYM